MPPVDWSVGDIRRQTAAEWSEIAQWSQWTPKVYRKLPSLFRMVPSLTPYDLFFPPQMGVANAPHTRKFATTCATGRIWWEERCHLLPNYSGPCSTKNDGDRRTDRQTDVIS